MHTEKAEERLAEIGRNIAEIERQLSDIEASVLANAKVIGATATKLFLSPTSFAGFDVVILDEASMLLLPALFHAAGLGKESVVISGDFRQLPPIMQSEQEALRRELGKDVFHVAGIEEDVRSRRSKRMRMLEDQFRMPSLFAGWFRCRCITGGCGPPMRGAPRIGLRQILFRVH